MAQITTGIRSLLGKPWVYDALQNLMGAIKAREKLVREWIKPFPGCRILDIGCGTAKILDHLQEVEYYGFDLSEEYIENAQERYGDLGNFKCAEVSDAILDDLPKFDIVMSIGVLHHLDDRDSVRLLQLAYAAMKPGARLITVDPCFTRDMNCMSRFLVSQDRGKNVRDENGYGELANRIFKEIKINIKHTTWIPYTHCIMQCVVPLNNDSCKSES